MQTYVLPTLGVVLLFTGVCSAQAKNSSALSTKIERAVANQIVPFANERVKQLCREWPTCEEWVANHAQQNPSFQVVDAEVARWVSKWEDGDTKWAARKSIWEYRFYVQTRENGQTKAYVFTRGDNGFSYNAPVEIKNFPGHPVPDKPTEHIVPVIDPSAAEYSLCDSWPGCQKFINMHVCLLRAMTSQYITKWDEQGNAVWRRRLYIETNIHLKDRAFYFQADQTTAGGDYTYQAPVEIKACPDYPTF